MSEIVRHMFCLKQSGDDGEEVDDTDVDDSDDDSDGGDSDDTLAKRVAARSQVNGFIALMVDGNVVRCSTITNILS